MTPVTTPTSGASVIPNANTNLAEFTVRIVSDSFVYLRVTRPDYRQLRNHFEMRKAQEAHLNSTDNINQHRAEQEQQQEQQQPTKPERSNEGTQGVTRRNTFHNTLVELLGR